MIEKFIATFIGAMAGIPLVLVTLLWPSAAVACMIVGMFGAKRSPMNRILNFVGGIVLLALFVATMAVIPPLAGG